MGNMSSKLRTLMGHSAVIQESLADPARYIDSRMIDYVIQDIEKNGKDSKFYTMFRRYQTATTDRQKEYYAALMMMSPKMAKNYVNEWYQKKVRNGEWNIEDYNPDGEDGTMNVNMLDSYESPDSASLGMFAGQQAYSEQAEPSRVVEITDFLTKFINHPKLTTNARLVVIARTMTGDTGGKGKLAGGGGIPLNEYVDVLPPEYDTVMRRIEDLMALGFSLDDINSTMILNGFSGQAPNGNEVEQRALVSKSGQYQATGSVREVLKDMTGVDVLGNDGLDLTKMWRYLLSKSVSESLRRSTSSLANVIDTLLSGKGKVPTAQAISAIVFSISELQKNPQCSLGKELKGKDLRKESRKYLNMLKSGKQADQDAVRHLFLSASLLNENKKVNKTVKEATKRLDKVKLPK